MRLLRNCLCEAGRKEVCLWPPPTPNARVVPTESGLTCQHCWAHHLGPTQPLRASPPGSTSLGAPMGTETAGGSAGHQRDAASLPLWPAHVARSHTQAPLHLGPSPSRHGQLGAGSRLGAPWIATQKTCHSDQSWAFRTQAQRGSRPRGSVGSRRPRWARRAQVMTPRTARAPDGTAVGRDREGLRCLRLRPAAGAAPARLP